MCARARTHLHVVTHPRKEVQRGEERGGGRQTEEWRKEVLRRSRGRNDLDETLLFAGRVTPGLCPPTDWHRHSVRMTEGQRPETGMGGFLSRAKARIKFRFREKGDEPPFCCPCPGHAFQVLDCL